MKDRIAMVRKEKGYSQEQFANELNLSRNFINQVESGKKNPSERTILDICSKFNVNEEWLRTGEGEMLIELSRKDKILAWATEALTGVSEDYRNRFVDVLDALSVDDWEVLANMAETMANRNKKKRD